MFDAIFNFHTASQFFLIKVNPSTARKWAGNRSQNKHLRLPETFTKLVASACLKKALVGCGWFHAGVGAGEEFGLEVASGCDGCSQTGSRDDYGGLGCCRRVRFLSRSTTRCDFAVVASVAQAASRRVSAAVLVGAVSAISRRPNVCRLRPRIASDR